MVDNENYNKKELWSNQKEIGYEINKWDKVFKNETSEICRRQPLKNLKGYSLLRQTISLQNF